VIACIEDPVVAKKILRLLDENAPEIEASQLPACRAPQSVDLFSPG